MPGGRCALGEPLPAPKASSRHTRPAAYSRGRLFFFAKTVTVLDEMTGSSQLPRRRFGIIGRGRKLLLIPTDYIEVFMHQLVDLCSIRVLVWVVQQE